MTAGDTLGQLRRSYGRYQFRQKLTCTRQRSRLKAQSHDIRPAMPRKTLTLMKTIYAIEVEGVESKESWEIR